MPLNLPCSRYISNAAFVLERLKPFAERTAPELKVGAVIKRVAMQTAGIPSARVIPFNLPPIIGLGTGGGFESQVGIVVLIGLASKNAILIVEFAMEERAGGKSVLEVAVSAARLRIRAVLMTSFAFILGLVPLVIASGAGEACQRGVGTAVFGGMLAASTVGIFLIPMLYVVFQRMRERFHGDAASRDAAPEAGVQSEG